MKIAEQLPRAVRSVQLPLSPDFELTVHVLDNGQHVVEDTEIVRFFDWLHQGTEPDFDLMAFAKRIEEV